MKGEPFVEEGCFLAENSGNGKLIAHTPIDSGISRPCAEHEWNTHDISYRFHRRPRSIRLRRVCPTRCIKYDQFSVACPSAFREAAQRHIASRNRSFRAPWRPLPIPLLWPSDRDRREKYCPASPR